MIRIKDIEDAMMPLVGWRQAYNPAQMIDEALTESESGLYYQDAHPLLTLDSMMGIMPDDWAMQYPKWNSIRQYEAGDKAEHGGVVWEASADNSGMEPPSKDFNGDYSEDFGGVWKPYNVLSDFLRRQVQGGISAMVQTFVQGKQLHKETRTLLERRTFFDGAGRIKATIQNTHKLAGFEIVPVRSMGVTTRIERIGLQMAGGKGNVTVYLMHSSRTEPVRVYNLDYSGNGGFQWFDVKDCHLPYVSDGNNAGGAWYLVYDQDALPMGMEAVNMSKDWSREPCGTCNQGSVQVWRELTKYIQVSPLMVPRPDGFGEQPSMWDVADNLYTNTQSYGLNCEITVGCDLTDFIIEQRAMFAGVLQKQVAASCLRTLAMNPSVRVNRNQSNATRTDILYEIDGNTDGRRPGGLGHELKTAYDALAMDTSGLDRVCLGCNNGGVRYKSI